MPPSFMDAKSSSSGFTSGEELDSSNSGLGQGEDAPGPVPRRWGTGPGQRKNRNRDAARRSRKKQTAKADELHKEHQCLERSNMALERDIAALRAEVRHYAAVLERHEPSCPLLGAGRSEASMLSLASTSTPTSTSTATSTSTLTSTSITAATLQEGSSRPSKNPCSPADSNPSSGSDVASPDRPRVSDVAPTVRTSCSRRGPGSCQPPRPAFGAPSPRRASSGPGSPAAPSRTHSFAPSTPVLTTLSLSDPPQLGDSSSSSSSSSSSASFIHLYNSHPLPPLASSRGRPASFTTPHPAPGSNLHFRSDRGSLETSATSDTSAILPPHFQGGPAAFYPYLGYPIHGSPGSSSVHAYQTGSPGTVFTTTSSGPGPYRGLMPGNLLPPLDVLDHLDILLPGVSMGATGSPTFSEHMATEWDLSSDISLSQLLQNDDWFQDC